MLHPGNLQNTDATQIDPAKAALIQKANIARAAVRYKYILLKKYSTFISLGLWLSIGTFFWNFGVARALQLMGLSYFGFHVAKIFGHIFSIILNIMKIGSDMMRLFPVDAEQNYQDRVNNLSMHYEKEPWKPLAKDEYLKNLLARLTAGAVSPTFINGNLDRQSLRSITTTYQAKLWSRRQIAKLGGACNRMPSAIIDKLNSKNSAQVLEKIRKKPAKYPPI